MPKNNLLSEQLNYIGASQTPTHLHLCSYNAEYLDRQDGKEIDDLIPYLRKDAINWIQIHGFQNIEAIQRICQHFNVDFLTMQDILNSKHLMKIEEHETYNVVILKLLFSSEDTYLPQQMAVIQGENFLLTFVERETDFFNDINTALEKNVLKIRNRQSDFLLSVILNSVMTSFMSIISDFEDGLEDLEEGLLSPGQDNMPGIEDIQQYRRNFRLIRKCILPFKEEIINLLHTTDNDLLHKANRPFFDDVNDHLQFVLQTLEGCRDMISALVDLYLSNNDQRMNSIMKQLTVVSTIFIPLTFLAGIWGMNFQWMPELGWKYGYLFAWALMFALVVVIYFYFKRKKWY
ncbi:MAG: magnesium/cobalt transporter CorA [Bacteroides sp.]|nr:magnesium/cobalt transporter CorA [Bacteroides sp.]